MQLKFGVKKINLDLLIFEASKYSSQLRSKVSKILKMITEKEISIKRDIHKTPIFRIIKSGNIQTLRKGGWMTSCSKIEKLRTRLDASLSTIKRRTQDYGLRNYRCTKKTLRVRRNFVRTHLN